jgi:hypothetical protein
MATMIPIRQRSPKMPIKHLLFVDYCLFYLFWLILPVFFSYLGASIFPLFLILNLVKGSAGFLLKILRRI